MYLDDETLVIASENIQNAFNDEQVVSNVSNAVVIQSERLTSSPEIQAKLDQLSPAQHLRLNNALVRRNGLVVEYNPVRSGLLGCNIAAYLLGSETQVIFLSFSIST